jgi:hypothetical protein
MRPIPVLFAAVALASAASAHAAIVWSTGAADVTFTKPALADPALAANQDRISPKVWITRASSAGLFNAVTQTSFVDGSPFGTEWAVANSNGNPNFTYGNGAANHASLQFSDWETAYGGRSNLKLTITAESAVLHLVQEDVYLDIKFTAWGGSSDGSFTLQRATGALPVPEPGSLAVAGLGAVSLLARRKRR